MLKADGLTVKQIKVENGCYEVYATDKAGKRVNVAYNAETLKKLNNAEAGEKLIGPSAFSIPMTSEREDRWVRVWDPFVRLFHWCLVLSFAVAWLSANSWENVHMLGRLRRRQSHPAAPRLGLHRHALCALHPFRPLAEDRSSPISRPSPPAARRATSATTRPAAP